MQDIGLFTDLFCEENLGFIYLFHSLLMFKLGNGFFDVYKLSSHFLWLILLYIFYILE